MFAPVSRSVFAPVSRSSPVPAAEPVQRGGRPHTAGRGRASRTGHDGRPPHPRRRTIKGGEGRRDALEGCAARVVLDGSPEAARSVAALLTGKPELLATVQVIRVEGLHAGAREQIAHAHPTALISAADGRGAVLVDPSDAPPVERLLAGLGCRVGAGTAVPVAQAGPSGAAATRGQPVESDGVGQLTGRARTAPRAHPSLDDPADDTELPGALAL